MKTRSIVALLLSLVMLLAGCGTKEDIKKDSKKEDIKEETKYAYESEHCKITENMLKFMFFFDFYNIYGNSADYYGFNSDLTFSEQICNAADTEGITWREHLLANTKKNAESAVYCAEVALKDGFKAEDLEEKINTQLDEWRDFASELGYTLEDYIKAYYGDSVTEATVRSALEIMLFAAEYKESISEEFTASLTEEDYDAYYNEHLREMEIVDVLTYAIPINYNGVIQTEARDSLMAAGEQSPEKFKEWVTDYITEKNSLTDNPKTDEALAESIEDNTRVQKSFYTEGGEFSEWAFADERKTGDTFCVEKNDGMYHIYLLTATKYPYITYTRDFIHIYCSAENNGTTEGAKAKAEELYAEWKSGDMTRESFEALAEGYNDDPEGAYHANSPEGFISGDFDNWLFNDSRLAGDHTVVASDYGGYHVVYYLGEGMPEWRVTAQEKLVLEYTEGLLEDYAEQYSDSLKKDETAYDRLPDILPEGARR